MSKEKARIFVRAEEGVPPAGYEKGSVRYYDKKGNVLIRYEGTKAWRCNNPGSIQYVKGGFAMRHGAIGHAMGMAVFPNQFAGKTALIVRLKTGKFPSYTIEKFPEIWEPKKIDEYRKMLYDISKLPPEKKIGDLSAAEFYRFRETIERIEGWKEGWEEFYEKE
jgi:hypothetical protein